jgi:sugar porter (SP) family MFS transporter
MFLMMALPALLYGVLAFTIPESPRYLVASHKIPEARRVLNMLLGEKNLEITIDRIKESLEREDKPSLRDLKKPTGGIYGIVWVGLGLSIFQQFVGINVIFYYGTTLWEAVGFSDADSLRINVISSTINIAATVIAILLIDRIGRRPLLLWGAVGMAVTLGVLALMFATATTAAGGKVTLSHANGLVALVAANLYVLAFGVSWGPAVWTMLSEMFPNRVRGSALAVAATAQWLANWLITVTFPLMLKNLGSSLAYLVYALFAAAAIFFVIRYVAETRGRTLEEM